MKNFHRNIRLTEFEEKALLTQMLKIWEHIYNNAKGHKTFVDSDCFEEGSYSVGLNLLMGLKDTDYIFNPADLKGTEENVIVNLCITTFSNKCEVILKENADFNGIPATVIIYKIPYYMRCHAYGIIHDSVFAFMKKYPELVE